jgi:DNA adenine methylase
VQLVRCFLEVRDDPERVHERLQILWAGHEAARRKDEFYYECRDTYNRALPKSDAALFIFLNRSCWNGLYRVNKKGEFNVPYGQPKSDLQLPTREELLNSSAALTTAHIRATTWQNTVALAEPGDFVFLDPPYYSEVISGRSDKYGKKGFGLESHRRLASEVRSLRQRGVDFVLTNSGEREMIELYRSHGLSVEVVQVPRPINSKPNQRAPVPELVVTS